MHRKDTKNNSFQPAKVGKDFTSRAITGFSGLSSFADYAQSFGLFSTFNRYFPTVIGNATKILNTQILIGIIFASLSGIFRLSKISTFLHDPLVRHLLRLKGGFEDSNLKARLLGLGKSGANALSELNLEVSSKCLSKSNLRRITVDCDSTETTVFGHQEGAEKGYNPHNKGKRCYHPLICFCSEMKIAINSWFRPGNTYTANGIVEFMKQTLAALPKKINQLFFRADSGFFNGHLFDLLEDKGHEYLVKAKLYATLNNLLKNQKWEILPSGMAVCQLDYKAKDWSKPRKMYGVRIIKGYAERMWLGTIERIPQYDYFCYCTNLKGLSAEKIHTLYGGRAECENWIENVKNQLCAGKTITDNFDVNDILWQLSMIAYNLSTIMRYDTDYKSSREEHKTFKEWFICVPGKVVTQSRKTTVKMSRHYIYAEKWMRFADKIPIAS